MLYLNATTYGQADYTRLERAVAPFVNDVRRTLDPGYSISFEFDGDWRWRSAYGTKPLGVTTAANVPGDFFELDECRGSLLLIREILEFDLDEVTVPWPNCPAHSDHSLIAEITNAMNVVWQCPIDKSIQTRIGSLNRPGILGGSNP